jgi:prepilin-type N-terminal cleavage/methylation domain-containing protein
MKLKRRKNEEGFTLIELIMVIVILGIISAVAIPKFINLGDSAKLASARGVGSAMNATLQARHADNLINASPYAMVDVLTGTSFSGGLAYDATTGADPALNRVCSVTDDVQIGVNIKGTIFKWDWTLPVGDTPALMIETPLKFPQP